MEVKTLKEKISKAKESGVEDMSKLKQALSELEKKGDTLVKKQNDLEKKEKVTLFIWKYLMTTEYFCYLTVY